jgi:hypothetical protein
METTLIVRPTRDAFLNAGWLPKDKTVLREYIQKLIDDGKKFRLENLGDDIDRFKCAIESDPTIYGDFLRMFDDPKPAEGVSNPSHFTVAFS